MSQRLVFGFTLQTFSYSIVALDINILKIHRAFFFIGKILLDFCVKAWKSWFAVNLHLIEIQKPNVMWTKKSYLLIVIIYLL